MLCHVKKWYIILRIWRKFHVYIYIPQRFPLGSYSAWTPFSSSLLTRHWSRVYACIPCRVSALDSSVSTEMLQPLCQLVHTRLHSWLPGTPWYPPGPGVTSLLGCRSRAYRQPSQRTGNSRGDRSLREGRVGKMKTATFGSLSQNVADTSFSEMIHVHPSLPKLYTCLHPPKVPSRELLSMNSFFFLPPDSPLVSSLCLHPLQG